MDTSPITGVITSVPRWQTLLDELNSKITVRQTELALLDRSRPSTQSLRKTGSNESLRLGKDDAILEDGAVHEDPLNTEAPALSRSTVFPATDAQTTSQSATPPALATSSSPATPVQRRASQRGKGASPHGTYPHNHHSSTGPYRPNPGMVRKRKTASVNSGESKPKYRTRSMIIVYYDSQVQDAFENLVKFISASRNMMRKGKMAARMAEMRRMAELELGDEDDDEDGVEAQAMMQALSTSKPAISADTNPAILAERTPISVGEDDDDDVLPTLRFVSTRRMGPSRDTSNAVMKMPSLRQHQSPLVATTPDSQRPLQNGIAVDTSPGNNFRLAMARNISLLGHYGIGASRNNINIYDELDSGLEWCQSMCEHAAHQFLRDGDCGVEIEGIKRRLGEVRIAAERELTANAETEKKSAAEKEEAMKTQAETPKEAEDLETDEAGLAIESAAIPRAAVAQNRSTISPEPVNGSPRMEASSPGRTSRSILVRKQLGDVLYIKPDSDLTKKAHQIIANKAANQRQSKLEQQKPLLQTDTDDIEVDFMEVDDEGVLDMGIDDFKIAWVSAKDKVS